MRDSKKENVNITEDAARLISRLSDGGMRDAVSLLDQCISVSADIDEETVRTTAGIAGTEHLFTLAQCIHEQNAPEALKILDELHNQSKDLMLLLDELLSHFRNLCILSATNSDFSLIPCRKRNKKRSCKADKGVYSRRNNAVYGYTAGLHCENSENGKA